MVRAVFFDVANTLLHKPSVFTAIRDVLALHGHAIDLRILERRHKLLSEAIFFPDKTSAEFYSTFNKQLLYALGVIPTKQLEDEIFTKCSYLPWEPYADLEVMNNLNLPLGVISNWDTSLKLKLSQSLPVKFDWVLGSESHGMRKPSVDFYSKINEVTGLASCEILYVGDSIKLDVEPALSLGFRVLLIDRIELYSSAKFPVIKNMKEVLNYL